MRIKIHALKLINFKGCKDLTINFGQETNILGANATGKTRIFDAFTWLFFGKDSEDKKDFSIKCIEPSGEAIHRQETSVSGDMEMDGRKKNFKRVFREKWQKKRGEEDHEFTGHETLFFIDGVPMLQNEYKKAVDSIISEETFKLLTNPFYFSSMRWDLRREILLRMVPLVTNETLSAYKPEFRDLLDEMGEKKIDLFKRELSSKKKQLKDSLAGIPPRIDELKKSMPELADYKNTEDHIGLLSKEIEDIERQIRSKNSRYEARHKELLENERKLSELRHLLLKLENESKLGVNKRMQELQNKIQTAKLSISNHESLIRTNEQALKSIDWESDEKEQKKARDHWAIINESSLSLPRGYDTCPTCKRQLDQEDIVSAKEALERSFNDNKIQQLKNIEEYGKGLDGIIANKKTDAEEISKSIEDSKFIINNQRSILSQLEDLLEKEKNNIPEETEQEKDVRRQISEMEATAGSDEEIPNVKPLKEKLSAAYVDLNKLNVLLSHKDDEAKLNTRISELEFQEKGLAQQLADMEKSEFLLEEMEKISINLVEEDINSLFEHVRFKMFNRLINGGTEPACDILINGVPFADANNSGKINAGIDIINTLAQVNDCHAPIFVDNAEAVNSLIRTGSQLIRLIVTEDQNLKTYIIEE
jgi:DNA repair exonuclease SbcCD ATPase subunit